MLKTKNESPSFRTFDLSAAGQRAYQSSSQNKDGGEQINKSPIGINVSSIFH